MKDVINAQYTRLCQELGDLESKIYQLTQLSNNLKQKIRALDELMPSLIHIESLKNTSEKNKDEQNKT